MKCMYFLAPTLDSAHTISDDLHEIGIDDWFLHIVSRDEAGLKKDRLHSSNYLEKLDLMRSGLIGANIGFIVGVIGAALIMFLKPFGADVEVPGYVYVIILIVATMFGAWEGGLWGIDSENKKLEPFHDDIQAGKYLILIYAHKGEGEPIKEMMRKKHPESEHVATDRHFFNPFAVVRRKRRTRAA